MHALYYIIRLLVNTQEEEIEESSVDLDSEEETTDSDSDKNDKEIADSDSHKATVAGKSEYCTTTPV